MSFQIGDYVKIVNPNHHKFGFEGTIDSVECKIGEYPYYKITRLVGLTMEIVVAQEYEIEETSIIKINTEGWEIGNFKAEKNEFGGLTISPRNVNDDAIDALKLALHTNIDKEEFNRKVKGEYENMELLEIYEERMKEKIRKEYNEKCEEIKAQDDFTLLRKSYEEDVKELYELEYEEPFPYNISYNGEFKTPQTKERLKEVEEEYYQKEIQLQETIKEIKAHLSIIPVGEYETAIKLLKKYGILNKDGKINV